MKLITFYLPQFHEIPENNDAWGKGFTEWTNVKKARPLFVGHNQPRKPLYDNYYNLLVGGVMEWQMALAKKYGIYGFCFYHYWFHGRLVLEKPIEMLRRNQNIDFHYCIAWANEPWTRTWHGGKGNKEIIIPQTYGREEEWELHYKYFRQFFLDKRYIKEKNCPVLLIYRLRNIPRFNDMLRYWNKCAKKDGFSGMFIVSMDIWRDQTTKSCWVDGKVDFEPGKTRAEIIHGGSTLAPRGKGSLLWNRFAIRSIRYKEINEKMLKAPHKKNQFRTVFVDFDDSPRRGERAVITRGSTPQRFGRYLNEAILRSKAEGNDYLFINAWNEWGEGNYLEPDTRHGYGYLRQIRKVLNHNT